MRATSTVGVARVARAMMHTLSVAGGQTVRPFAHTNQPLLRESGFTLLEVLVAFIIAAVALTSLYQGALAALNTSRIAGRYQEATAIARSRLEATGRGAPPVLGEAQGDDGDFHWRVRVSALAKAGPPRNLPPASVASLQGARTQSVATLYGVTVAVSWHEAGRGSELDRAPRVVRLDSERLGPPTR